MKAVIPILVTTTNTVGAAISTEITLEIRAHAIMGLNHSVVTAIVTVLITSTLVPVTDTSCTLEIQAHVALLMGLHHQVATVIPTAFGTSTTTLISAIITSCMLTVLTIALGSHHQTITATLNDFLTRLSIAAIKIRGGDTARCGH